MGAIRSRKDRNVKSIRPSQRRPKLPYTRASHACDHCRKRKIRCNTPEAENECDTCFNRGKTCLYTPTPAQQAQQMVDQRIDSMLPEDRELSQATLSSLSLENNPLITPLRPSAEVLMHNQAQLYLNNIVLPQDYSLSAGLNTAIPFNEHDRQFSTWPQTQSSPLEQPTTNFESAIRQDLLYPTFVQTFPYLNQPSSVEEIEEPSPHLQIYPPNPLTFDHTYLTEAQILAVRNQQQTHYSSENIHYSPEEIYAMQQSMLRPAPTILPSQRFTPIPASRSPSHIIASVENHHTGTAIGNFQGLHSEINMGVSIPLFTSHNLSRLYGH